MASLSGLAAIAGTTDRDQLITPWHCYRELPHLVTALHSELLNYFVETTAANLEPSLQQQLQKKKLYRISALSKAE